MQNLTAMAEMEKGANTNNNLGGRKTKEGAKHAAERSTFKRKYEYVIVIMTL